MVLLLAAVNSIFPEVIVIIVSILTNNIIYKQT